MANDASDNQTDAGEGPREIMTVAQAAEWLSLHPETVRNEIRARRLPAKRIGKEWRLSRTAIIRWLSTPADDLDRYTRKPARQSDSDPTELDLAAEDRPSYEPGPP